MKYNSKYRVAKSSADGWNDGMYDYSTIQHINGYLKQNRKAKMIKIFFKRLRKINKPLWHRFVD